MKTFKTGFNKLSKNEFLRLDFGIRYVDDILDFNPLQLTTDNYILLSDVLTELRSKKKKKGDLENDYFLVDLENINKRYNSLINVERVNSINSDKTVINEGDLVIAKMTPKLGTMFLNLEHSEYIGSTELIEYKISNYDALSLYYILTSKYYLDILGYLESGKNQRRVTPKDLLKLKIPKNKDSFKIYVSKAYKTLNSMFSLQKNIQEIINISFNKELYIKEIITNKRFETQLNTIGNDNLCRFSFHNQNYFKSFEFEKLDSNKWCPIEKKFIVNGGKRIPKGKTFSSDKTPYYYLRPNEVTLYGIDNEKIPHISEELHSLLSRYTIKTGDFCISNVGTLGKIGLVNLDELGIKDGNLILSENFIKLTPSQKLNSKFYYYFFNSYIFKKQIDREYTITSVMKLGLDKIKKILIPNFSSDTENKIISMIESELNKQKELKKQIEYEREKIDKECFASFSS